MSTKSKIRAYGKVDYPIFLVAALCCLIFYLPLVLFQDQMGILVPKILKSVTFSLDWAFETVCFCSLVFCLWLALGRFGGVKLGKTDERPEFSTFTWIAMFFCAGVGAGAVYWAFLEPLSLLENPPFGVAPFSAEARLWSITYPCFHWSLTPWAIFAVPAVAFAYSFYNHGKTHLRASDACCGVLGRYAAGLPGKAIDIFVIIGMFGGMTTSLGFVFPMLSGLISDYCGIGNTLQLQMVVGFFFTLIFGYSCYRGLYSGIAKLSNINMVMFIGVIVFVFLAGPSLWLISNFTESIGQMAQNYIRMSFYIDASGQSGFPQTWTVFYWAWWLSWAVYIGLFMARISKGRSLRSFILNMLFTAGGGSALLFAIIGGYSEYAVFDLGIDVSQAIADGNGYHGISLILNTLPFAKAIIPVFIVILAVAQATGVDSAAYTLSDISCREMISGKEPPRWIRIFWALAIFFASVALLLMGGMEVVKLSSVLTAVPLLFLQVLFMISVIRWLKSDFSGR